MGIRRGIACAMLALSLTVLSACSFTTQTSSGRDYLAAQPEWTAATAKAPVAAQPGVAKAVYDAANAEPILRFPARIGLARIEGRRISPIPPMEAEAWVKLAEEKGGTYGSFVPISPILAAMATRSDGVETIVDQIRVGAARQHVDAVLIYEVGSTREDSGSILSVLDLTIVGAWVVPSRSVGGKALASALLVDVRNGYPYGTASASAEESGISTNYGSTARAEALVEQAKAAAVQNLTAETLTMLAKLKGELEAKELAELRALQAQGKIGRKG